ncbi:MAG: hypothetical protein AAGE01_02675 [Pseudomonadota bacterium]
MKRTIIATILLSALTPTFAGVGGQATASICNTSSDTVLFAFYQKASSRVIAGHGSADAGYAYVNPGDCQSTNLVLSTLGDLPMAQVQQVVMETRSGESSNEIKACLTASGSVEGGIDLEELAKITGKTTVSADICDTYKNSTAWVDSAAMNAASTTYNSLNANLPAQSHGSCQQKGNRWARCANAQLRWTYQ